MKINLLKNKKKIDILHKFFKYENIYSQKEKGWTHLKTGKLENRLYINTEEWIWKQRQNSTEVKFGSTEEQFGSTEDVKTHRLKFKIMRNEIGLSGNQKSNLPNSSSVLPKSLIRSTEVDKQGTKQKQSTGTQASGRSVQYPPNIKFGPTESWNSSTEVDK